VTLARDITSAVVISPYIAQQSCDIAVISLWATA